MATTEPTTIQRVTSGSVIIYDLADHTIRTQKAEKFKGTYFDRYVLSYTYHKL